MTDQNLERDIPERLRELAAATPEPAWDTMEQRLLGAFAEQRASGDRRPLRGTRRATGGAMWRGAAAAGIVLAAAITFYPRSEPRHVPPATPTQAPRDVTKTPASEPATERTMNRAPEVQSSKPAPRVFRPEQRRGMNLSTDQVGTSPAASDTSSAFSGFVALPGASALPDFESGRIMRIELTLTELPAYGLDMVLDAAPGPIEADLLVGQDGVPRAIRLASTDSY